MTRVVRDWGAIVQVARQHPNHWVLAPGLEGIPRRVWKVARLRQVQALRDLPDGELQFYWQSRLRSIEEMDELFPGLSLRGISQETGFGDIYLRWIPAG